MRELEHRNEVEKAADLLSRLNIASEGKTAMSKLEWTGNYNDNNKSNSDTTKIIELDSDEEEDPLRILAQVICNLYKVLIITFTEQFILTNINCI